MFITEADKQAIRLGAYIVFLEQLLEQQKKEFEAVKTELASMKKEKEDGKLDGSEGVAETAGTSEPKVSKPQ